ncbi:MAG TPA: oligosaccharide flippase family protein [Chitinophagaceae bacterium]|nr:oligosaccharide flippase family protein [Chitinophagaceae bacterium]
MGAFMSSLKNLAAQTLWYGLSSIAARFIGYLQNPIITYLLADSKGQQAFGDFSVLFAGISLANILFTYGMETAYFRFAAQKEDPARLFRTSFGSLLISTVLLGLLFIVFRQPLAELVHQEAHPEYIAWAVLIIGFDTLSAIPFARLRHEGRPKKYAAIRIGGILLNLVFTVTLLYFCQRYADHHPDAAFTHWYQGHSKGGLLLLPFIAQSLFTFLLLYKEWKDFRLDIDRDLLRRMWRFGSPMIIVGLGGMINETMDRIMLLNLYTGTEAAAKEAVAIYNANYKISIFITLFIQAFKMSAEPFFFKQAAEKNAPVTYAIVMKWFVVTLCVAFLFSALFLDVWKYMNPKTYWSGLPVVPVLLCANICLGIYYNLVVAFKVTDNMRYATYITLIGAAITLGLNITFIPVYGMIACAWTTLACYCTMMVLAYFWGQKYFPVPYPVRTICSYLLVVLGLFGVQQLVRTFFSSFSLLSGVLLMFGFMLFLFKSEKNTLKSLPFIGKWVARL